MLLFCRRRIFKHSQGVFVDFFHFLLVKHCSMNRAKLANFNPLFLLPNVKTIKHCRTDHSFFRFYVSLVSMMMSSQSSITSGCASSKRCFLQIGPMPSATLFSTQIRRLHFRQIHPFRFANSFSIF